MSIFKKILTSILAVGVIVLAVIGVEAFAKSAKVNSDGYVYANLKTLETTDNLFCVNHSGHMTYNEDPQKFKVISHFVINGNEIRNVANDKTYEDKSNGILAYILAKAIDAGGYGTHNNYASGQRALYAYYNTWANKFQWKSSLIHRADSYNTNVSQTDASKKILENAKEYASSVNSSGVSLEDKTNKNNIKVTQYNDGDTAYLRVGPFKWNFTGEVQNVTVYSEKGKINNVKYSTYNGTKYVKISKSEIKSGKAFYINLKVSDIDYNTITKISAKVKGKSGTVYKADIKFLKRTKRQNLILANVTENNIDKDVTEEFNYNIKLIKSLTIIKEDSRDSNIKLANVEFIIQNKSTGKYVVAAKSGDTYTVQKYDSKAKATTFVTDENGQIKIDNLIYGNYLAYETYNPNYGYKEIEGSIEIVASKKTVEVPNDQIYVKLSGYIWQDMIADTKTKQPNEYFKTNNVPMDGYDDSNDINLNGIVVRLKDRKGNVIQEATSSELGIYSEADGGEYQFTDVLVEELANYYVEFEYDGLFYQSVPLPVNGNVTIDKTTNSSSKATDIIERTELDKSFTSVEATGSEQVNVNGRTIDYNKVTEDYASYIAYDETKYQQTSVKDTEKCAVHAITRDYINFYDDYYTPGTTEIKYINLGINEKAQADLALGEDLETVNVGVNGYWHVYKYGSRDYSSTDTWNVGVRMMNENTGTYKRAVYKSDVEYQSEDKSKELQVYLTYKIVLKNESSYLSRVNNITQYYDSRYQLVAAGTGLDEKTNSITGNVNVGTSQAYSNSDGNFQKVNVDVNSDIESGKAQNIYIQFKLDREAVIRIMSAKETLYVAAEINSYSVYKDANKNTVAVVDKDSVPGNVTLGNSSTMEDDTEGAPPILLELTDAREVQGQVFVDSTSGELQTGSIRQGDGEFKDGEQTVSGVKVTLTNEDGTVAKIYNGDHHSTADWNNEANWILADNIYTDENGAYTIPGFIPGKYNITFTWGDKTYTVQEYKGTIYNDSSRQTRTDANNNPWYKDETPRYSDAIDDYTTRIAIDNQIAAITDNTVYAQIAAAYQDGYTGDIINKMNSTTPTLEFSVEYDTNITNGTGDQAKFIVNNVDFGIVERARQQLDMSKNIKSFKITLANGQVLADATLEKKTDSNGVEYIEMTGTTNYVTYMPAISSNGYDYNGAIRAEIDSELIEGATLEIGYKITVTNNSEVEYMSEEYYKYGTQTGNIATLTPSAVVDYLDANLGFVQTQNTDWQEITVDQLKTLNATKINDTEYLNGRLILYTEATAKALAPTQSTDVTLNVSKLLSTSGDTTFNNDAELVKAEKPNNNSHKGREISYFPADSAEEAEIIPSTGEDKNFIIPITVGVIALVVLGLGVFLIKRKATDNK